MTNPTPVAWINPKYPELPIQKTKPNDGGYWEPVFTTAQLNQAKADALREAAEKFSHNLLGQQNLDARNGVVLAINELRRTSDEIDGGKE